MEYHEHASINKSVYESKLTELHSVIAELKKKLEVKKNFDVILEETNSLEDDEYFEDDFIIQCATSTSTTSQSNLSDSNNIIGDHDDHQHSNNKEENSKSALSQISLEVTKIRAEHHAIRETLREKEIELEKAKNAIRGISKERDELRGKVTKLEKLLTQQQSIIENSTSPVRLAKIKHLKHHPHPPPPLPSQISTTKTAETIVNLAKLSCESEFCEKNSSQEVNKSSEEQGVEEFLLIEKLSSKVEHLKSQNNVLMRNLEDARFYCDQVALMVGQYESNSVVTSIVNEMGTHTLEGYDILVALLESELGQLLANCRAAGIGRKKAEQNNKCEETETEEEENVNLLLARANQNRITAENAARNFVQKLGDLFYGPQTNSNNSCNNNNHHHLNEMDAINCQNKSPKTNNNNIEKSIRSLIIQLKTHRSKIESTLTPISWNMEPLLLRKSGNFDDDEVRRMDLETAVLMQELMSMREERAELRAKMFLLQKENQSLVSRNNSYYLQLQEKISTSEENSPEEENNNSEKLLERKISLENFEKNEELINELKQANEIILETLEDVKKKYQNRIKRMEEEICKICERHAKEILHYRNLIEIK